MPLLMLIAACAAGKPPPHRPAHKPVHKPVLGAPAKAATATGPADTPRPPPAPADDPANKAVAAELRTQARGALAGVYAQRGFWPLWAHGGRIGPEAKAFLHDLDTAELDGLDPARFDTDKLRALVKEAGNDPAFVAHAELALSAALAAYVRDVRRAPAEGMTWLDPDLKPARLRPEAVLRAAGLAPSFADYVTGMGWMDPLYVHLRDALAKSDPDRFDDEQRRRVRLTMDRLRILPGASVRHIVVDAANARLYYYDGGRQQGTMKVVVGAVETPTPMLAGRVRYAILNPYWNVPVELAQRKIAPRVLAGATLRGLRYEALDGWSRDAAIIDPATIDWPAVAAGKAEIRLRQLPGGTNAMGRVKFMFPNNDGIYLHDTPEKALMLKSDRHFSNGCVRLEDAPRLGRWLLGGAFAAPSKGPEQDVPLDVPTQVYLTYLTVVPTAKGIGFVDDVYGRDGAKGKTF